MMYLNQKTSSYFLTILLVHRNAAQIAIGLGASRKSVDRWVKLKRVPRSRYESFEQLLEGVYNNLVYEAKKWPSPNYYEDMVKTFDKMPELSKTLTPSKPHASRQDYEAFREWLDVKIEAKGRINGSRIAKKAKMLHIPEQHVHDILQELKLRPTSIGTGKHAFRIWRPKS